MSRIRWVALLLGLVGSARAGPRGRGRALRVGLLLNERAAERRGESFGVCRNH